MEQSMQQAQKKIDQDRREAKAKLCICLLFQLSKYMSSKNKVNWAFGYLFILIYFKRRRSRAHQPENTILVGKPLCVLSYAGTVSV